MKKIFCLVLILIVFGFRGFSQITYTPMIAGGYQIKYLKTDSGFALPLRDTTVGRGINRAGLLVARPADNLPYYYNGTNWVLLGTSGGLVPDVTLQDAFDNDPTALPKINAHNQSFNVDSTIGVTLSSRSNSISGKIGQIALSAGTFSLQNSTPQVGGTFGSTISSADSLLVGLAKNNANETRFRLSPSDFLVGRLGGSYKSIGTSINGDPFDETGNIELNLSGVRFGIEDNIGIQDRSVNMNHKNLIIDSVQNVFIGQGTTADDEHKGLFVNDDAVSIQNINSSGSAVSYFMAQNQLAQMWSDDGLGGIGHITHIDVTPEAAKVYSNGLGLGKNIIRSINGLEANDTGNITIAAAAGTVTNVTGTAPVIITGTSTITPNVTVDTSKAGGRVATYSDVILKQNLVTLTTTGTSGASTFNQGTGALNIPNYAVGITGVGNIGAGYRLVTTSGTNVKTLFAGLGTLIDSISNANGLTLKIDTSYGKKYFTTCLTVLNDSIVLVDVACIKALLSVTGENYLAYNNSTGVFTASPVNLSTTNATGVAPIARGGTNNGSLSVTAGTLYYGDGTKVIGLGPGTAAQHLTGGTTPVWRDTAVVGASINYWSLTGNDIYNNNNSGNGSVGVGSNGVPASKFSVQYDGVGSPTATYVTDSTHGIALVNNLAATVSLNQSSPIFRWRASGWSTNSGGATMKVEAREYLSTTTGAAAPTGTLAWQFSVNGAAWSSFGTNQMALGNTGNLSVAGTGAFIGNITGATISTSTAGIFTTAKAPGAAETDGILMNGSATASGGTPVHWSPAIRMISNAWDGTATNYYNEFFTQVRGVNGTIPTTSAYWWSTRTSTTATGTINDLLSLNNKGKFTFLATNTAGGTTGAQTIDKASGTVNFAAAATSLVVTNALVTTSSIVFAEVRTNDANKTKVYAVVPGAGSFTIYVDAAPAAEISVCFWVIN